MLLPGITYTADLDGDKVPETIRISKDSLTITDGKVAYHSRDKWKIVQACLGDTDHDGLPEIVTLLDDSEGRHVGLFAYFGGSYRERIVTSEITPRPVELEIVSLNLTGNPKDTVLTNLGGDFIVLTQEPAPGQTEPTLTVLRWNGFGFTPVTP